MKMILKERNSFIGLLFLVGLLHVNYLIADDCLDLFDTYLKEQEFIMDKKGFNDIASKIYPGDDSLKFFYPKAIIPYDSYRTLLKNFLATYQKAPQNADYVQKIEIPEGAQVYFIGDLHGSIHALIRMMCKLMNAGVLNADLKIIKSTTYLIFLGDYIDYGRYGADTLALMMRLRVKNPSKVFACCGNHEDSAIYTHDNYGFYEELKARYGRNNSVLLKQEIDKAFKLLPLAIFVGIQNNSAAGFIQCCHGGLEINPKNQKEIKKLLTLPRYEYALIHYSEGEQSNLKWGDFTGSDHHNHHSGWSNGRSVAFNIAGLNNYMGKEKEVLITIDGSTSKTIFCMDNLIQYVFRGHQDQSYACKNLINGIPDPLCLFPIEAAEKTALHKNRSVQHWIGEKSLTLTTLSIQGFELGQLPQDIGPVFTFSNASASKVNYDEGFGQLSVSRTWQESRLRFHIDRPELFTQRAALYTADKDEWTQCLGNDAPVNALYFNAMVQSLLFLPTNTYIDKNGNATIKIDKKSYVEFKGNKVEGMIPVQDDNKISFGDLGIYRLEIIKKQELFYRTKRFKDPLALTKFNDNWFDKYSFEGQQKAGICQAFKDKIRAESISTSTTAADDYDDDDDYKDEVFEEEDEIEDDDYLKSQHQKAKKLEEKAAEEVDDDTE